MFRVLPIFFPLRYDIPNSNSIFNVDISGNYKVQLYDPRTNGFAPSSPGIGMHVEVRDPDDKIILSKDNTITKFAEQVHYKQRTAKP